ncbi:TPT-domain-containing protein [Hanseniaspora valbyensis NRRL Y-1626]|uniref:GDP-mannose transporter n=1 Tax=Hanseniaspora valbyensis NRRL Y-1626 TaxID=766949 RepID=A0A1B7TFK1_9ASCO|nr:TPT-domain-containing protein [Hanseniaspora valbyensis NRRL Y-1626]
MALKENFKLVIVLLVACWYASSITISLYNKHIISTLQIPYPLLMTSFHQLILYLLTLLYITFIQPATTESHRIPWKFKLPVAICTALDVGLSNLSLKYVTLTVYLVIKTSSLAFVLFFSIVMKLEKFDWRLLGIVVVMMGGVVGMTLFNDSGNSNPQEDERRREYENSAADFILGVILVLGSAFLGGLRWVVTQLILRTNKNVTNDRDGEEDDAAIIAHAEAGESFVPLENRVSRLQKKRMAKKKNPIRTIKQLAPISSLTLVITSLFVEKPDIGFFYSKITFEHKGNILYILNGFLLLLFPGLLVFILTLSEYSILQKTNSSLTLSILGILKEVVTILLSMLVLRERLSKGFGQWISMIVIIGDAVAYNAFRVYQDRQDAKLNENVGDRLLEEQRGFEEEESEHDNSGLLHTVASPFRSSNNPVLLGTIELDQLQDDDYDQDIINTSLPKK